MSETRWIFLSVMLTSFMGPFMGSSINMAIPAMAREFQVPVEQLSWVVAAFLLGSVAALIPFGKLADIVGHKRLYRRGLVALIVTTAACGLAVSAAGLILARLLQGIALAMLFSTSMAMLVASHKPAERGRVIGYSAAATYIGLSAGPVLGGAITEYLGWRLIFFLTTIGILLSLAAMAKVKDEWYGAKGEKLDGIGSCIYCAASTMTLYGLSASASYAGARYLLLAGLTLFAVFLWEQRRARYPLIDWQLFGNGIFALSNLAAMIHYSATFALGFLLSLYLQLIRGFDAASAGLFLLLQPAMMALFSPLAGRLSDQLQPRIVASAGMAITAMGLLAFSFLTAGTSLEFLGANLLFIGIGFAFFSSPNSNAVMGAVAPRHYGVAAAILSVMRLSGQAISMAVVTVLLAFYTAEALPPEYLPSLLTSFQRIFSVLAAICAIGVVVSLKRGKKVS